MSDYTLYLSCLISILLILSYTALTIVLMVITQTTLISLSIYFTTPCSWFSFIFFLIFVSAMMIIFVYISSLASNDFMPLMSSKTLWVTMMVTPIYLLSFILPSSHLKSSNSTTTLSDLTQTFLPPHKLYASYTTYTTLFLMAYLLFALIVVIKNSSTTVAPLRSQTY
uniref:NADH dehydrogenase subunit 6 n=1 Tax=Gammarus nipponensis TaxID=353628 RepID=UPI00286B2BB6|nr:NADH dehydrogenase subunit 6 [Gammarus nipponensis]WLS55466.1 NADH dehydrogenase subunit 6 [Gammarus nipponensis]